MALIDISMAEHGVIRVFAISRPMSDMARALKQQPKAALASEMLSHAVSAEDIEIFAISDLEGVGLPAYLTDGYDIDKDAIRTDRRRLDALDGYILLLFSRVSNDGDVTLNTGAELTLIGTYAGPKASHTGTPIASSSAAPYSGVATAPKTPTRSRVGSAITAMAVLAALLLIWWILR
jgi:hypothetical protein